MAEITLIEALASEQVIGEVEGNLQAKMSRAMPAFRMLVQRCLQVVPDPTSEAMLEHEGRAHEKDLPILVAAVREQCPWLITFNVNDYKPGHPEIVVLRPGDFVQEVRYLLGRMG